MSQRRIIENQRRNRSSVEGERRR
ncbi:hypothetical protein, partial, partial [Absidia glauca]